MRYAILSKKLNRYVGSTVSKSEASRINKSGTHLAILESEYLELFKRSKRSKRIKSN